jgi:hypothetical protein
MGFDLEIYGIELWWTLHVDACFGQYLGGALWLMYYRTKRFLLFGLTLSACVIFEAYVAVT